MSSLELVFFLGAVLLSTWLPLWSRPFWPLAFMSSCPHGGQEKRRWKTSQNFQSELAAFKQASHKPHTVIPLTSHWNGSMDFEVGS